MEMGMGFGGIWLLHLGVLGILDAKLFAKAPPEGERPVGPLVWGIAVLAIAGLTALSGLWDLISMLGYIEVLEYQPVMFILGFLGSAMEVTLCVFLILGGISRIRRLAPSKAVLKIVLGCCTAGLGLTAFAAQFAMGPMYYY